MGTITILLKPNYKTTREKMGIEEFEDYNGDRVLFQQGYDMQEIEIEPGEVFTISRKFDEAYVQCDGKKMKLILNDEFEDDDEDDEQLNLGHGKYQLHEDGLTIEKIDNAEDEFGDDFDDEVEY